MSPLQQAHVFTLVEIAEIPINENIWQWKLQIQGKKDKDQWVSIRHFLNTTETNVEKKVKLDKSKIIS